MIMVKKKLKVELEKEIEELKAEIDELETERNKLRGKIDLRFEQRKKAYIERDDALKERDNIKRTMGELLIQNQLQLKQIQLLAEALKMAEAEIIKANWRLSAHHKEVINRALATFYPEYRDE